MKGGGGKEWGRRRMAKKESLPDLPEITYVIFSLKRKCILGEARLCAVCAVTCDLTGPVTAAVVNQSNARLW